MFGMTSAVLIKADADTAPEPFLLGGGDNDLLTEIQSAVGGTIDAVRRGASDETGETPPFIIVGYVHDEGIILKLPLNPVATVLFEQNIFGDCLVVSGTNPETGDYDGENYDLPATFSEYLMSALHLQVQESLVFSRVLSQAVRLGLRNGTVTEAETEAIMNWMTESSDKGVAYGSISQMPQEMQDTLKRAFMGAVSGLLKDDDEEEGK